MLLASKVATTENVETLTTLNFQSCFMRVSGPEHGRVPNWFVGFKLHQLGFGRVKV